MIVGPTMSVNVFSVQKKEEDGMFQKLPERLIIAYTEYQSLLEEMEKYIDNLILHQRLSSKEQIEEWSDCVKHTV
jgi:hypothetical protein